jgi:hypothetical protein
LPVNFARRQLCASDEAVAARPPIGGWLNYIAFRELSGKLVTVIGGSGFFGRHLGAGTAGARRAAANRQPQSRARLCAQAARQPWAGQFLRCDVTRPKAGRALAGSDAVVNLVGAFAGDLDAVQGKGAGKSRGCGPPARAGGFVHVSAIGADADRGCRLCAHQGEGEAGGAGRVSRRNNRAPLAPVRAGRQFRADVRGLIAALPVLPVFAPEAQLQPVFVDDAAAAVANAILADPAASMAARPSNWRAGTDHHARAQPAHRRGAGPNAGSSNCPTRFGRPFATLTGWLPGAPISATSGKLLKAGSVADRDNACPASSRSWVSCRVRWACSLTAGWCASASTAASGAR